MISNKGPAVKPVAIIGGGPAGLMAAEVLAEAGQRVIVFDAMPSVGRKFLMAGKSGLNITHAEEHAVLLDRFGLARPALAAALDAFIGSDIRAWCDGLGIETFVGSSGRIFPRSMKGSPLLRAWLARLAGRGVEIRTRHRWTGISGERLTFATQAGPAEHDVSAVLLALGGASWPRLGSDAAWVPILERAGVPISPFRPANCGFEVDWSPVFAERFAGMPVKAVTATAGDGASAGEFVVTQWGIEGSLVYAHSAALRDRLAQTGTAALTLDLMPGRSTERLLADLLRQPAKLSLSNRLRKGAGLDPVKIGLLREIAGDLARHDEGQLAWAIKALPLRVKQPRPLAEAISSAGGLALDAIDERYMIKAMPGFFAAGEMLDWEAPTGGYLLTACLATGRAAARGLLAYLETSD